MHTILFHLFVLEVVKLLVTRTPLPPTIIRGPPEENYVRLNGRHFPMLKEASATPSNKHPTKVCKVCYAQGKSTTSGLPLRTSYVCGDSPSQPGLHVEYQGQYCFKIYHTELNFGSPDNHDWHCLPLCWSHCLFHIIMYWCGHVFDKISLFFCFIDTTSWRQWHVDLELKLSLEIFLKILPENFALLLWAPFLITVLKIEIAIFSEFFFIFLFYNKWEKRSQISKGSHK